MSGGHPSTPRSRDFMALNGTPAKRTFSVSRNDPNRRPFVRLMSGENLSKISDTGLLSLNDMINIFRLRRFQEVR
jgi:hypothetical protein